MGKLIDHLSRFHRHPVKRSITYGSLAGWRGGASGLAAAFRHDYHSQL
ncbi:hypothetical protein SAMN04487959_110102 [Modicisalibacter xianhensis]|uniref:Uncharacterized protein n=1 Tax=Modicisalibacter xianhensis TaxID=442341 RepID=A0A1I3DA48_9GAMM|nr:hypothetical protein SAMN04487959_110102 [Halomonas xianhensis]